MQTIPADAQPRWSRHARRRSAQRSIPRDVAELILAHGRARRAGRHARLVRMDRRDAVELSSELPGRERERLRNKLRARVVLGEDGTVVTVLWPRR